MAHSDDPGERLKSAKKRVDKAAEAGDITDQDRDLIHEVIAALDESDPTHIFNVNGQDETKSLNTLSNYTTRLRLAAKAVDSPLSDLDTDSVNQLMADFGNGDNDIAPSGGYANNTLKQYQSALKAFYRYHDGHAVDPEEIPVATGEPPSVDERDMFTVEEMKAMRDVIQQPRNRALFEMLAYTGQRVRVIQTLRIKDIDIEGGVFYINDEIDGRKGAEGKRPLLGAKEYVRQWLDYHPTGEPEDALFTKLPGAGSKAEPGDPLGQVTIRKILKQIADRAGVDKQVNPHIFRHYFTTIAKRDYGMDDAHIKQLRGDSPGSNVMETTYQHLSIEDSIQHAEEKAGLREPEETAHTVEICPTCGHHLEPGAKACGRCGAVFTPDAVDAKNKVQQDIGAEKALSVDELTEEDLEAIADSDPVLARLIELRSSN